MGNWSGIEEFYSVAHHRSFTQAAERLGMSTSQVSREVAQLENRLGQRLLYRSTRRVSLTEAGAQFLVRCRRMLEDRDEALAAVANEAPELQGHLRITCSERFVVPMINRFMLAHPRLSVEVLLANELMDLVDYGIDVAVRFGHLSDSRLIATRIGTRERYLCATPAYLAGHGYPASLDDLARHDCVCGADEIWPFLRDGRPFEHRPNRRFRCNSGYAVVDAALHGLGLCQLPDFYVAEELRSGVLVEVLAEHRPEKETVWAVYPHRQHVPSKVRLAIEHLQREFRDA
jgi:DNA-binding transcriptional LysR family regulator